jgi:hypothetical protein
MSSDMTKPLREIISTFGVASKVAETEIYLE